ncbi:hypothetical protein ACVR0O_01465 [Streptococcus caviae]|uniref:hypothetical protein n=1 Tax=Streptococcus sp. 'caviae' TaxID=1915004 RepID=UPI00094BB76F|nr:hypothetical protein [Streptococcus sp. 'caviae']OLN84593.1 hypothetical protein BMI76_00505 [Streptococcus sp. 'caviae']
MKPKNNVTGFTFLWLALYAAAAFLFEILLVPIEEFFGISLNQASPAQMIGHWIVTSLGWLALGLAIIALGKKQTGLDLLKGNKKRVSVWQWLAVILSFVLITLVQYWDWKGFKILIEFQHLGWLKFVFQYLYYIAESFLISLVLVFGQKAFELWFKNDKIPYGGILLGLTWGLMHILSKGSVLTGILTCLAGFLFGSVYLLVNKDYKKTLVIVTCLFML